ncbi:hypothetical protein [Psychromonas sp. Urea-02u-13]|uniref:hypothetical protein n=1 Tax=Psychromonas sp. Urea-02u-13 TaxID=2058326 RepID=UPI000C31F115|nr:hypothetical protein [Psychromonas sp. Urea-02u-13]PKG37430.1 hypothetical protein CXF74_18915 [Psychromonas sp. Urea-02u-13]
MKKRYLLIPLLTAFVVIAIWQFNNSVYMQVDRCLDSGGSFDYQSCQCDDKNNHELIAKHRCD